MINFCDVMTKNEKKDDDNFWRDNKVDEEEEFREEVLLFSVECKEV